jgi:hypothetical protein
MVDPPVMEITPAAMRSAVAWPVAGRFVWDPASDDAARLWLSAAPGNFN